MGNRRVMRVRGWAAAAAALTFALTVCPALAQRSPAPRTATSQSDDPGPAADESRVQLRILAIVATNENERIDPALRELAAKLRPTFRFSGYRLARTEQQNVALDRSTSFRLVEPYTLDVMPTQIGDERIELIVQALRASGERKERVLSLRVRLKPGTYQLLGGWPVKDGTLLAAVTAVQPGRDDDRRAPRDRLPSIRRPSPREGESDGDREPSQPPRGESRRDRDRQPSVPPRVRPPAEDRKPPADEDGGRQRRERVREEIRRPDDVRRVAPPSR